MPSRCSALVLALLATLMTAPAQDRPTGRPWTTRSEVLARHGMAATSQPLATQAALRILERGGSAVDASIAANAVLGLVEPTGCGIGGDLFAMVWEPEAKKLHGLNGSGRSPASLTLEHLRGLGLETIPARGPLPVTVPGCVDGWFALHARFGRLPIEDLLAPAIALAREGFPVTAVIAQHWEENAKVLREWPGFADVFLPDGRAPRKGEVFFNHHLADTYAQLAENGRDAFYRGAIARTIEAYLREHGGFLTAADLGEHRSEWVEPVSTRYRGYDVYELPPNGQGIAALQMLNVLEEYDLASMGFGSAEYLHLLIESKKLAFEDRARWYADPAFAPAPVAALLSKDYAAKRRARIDRTKAAKLVPPGDPVPGGGDTIYLTTADQDGMMVSLIQSNYRGMGSGMTPPGLGFCLQDRGELFDLEPGRPNSYAPRKRPFHTIIPAFVAKDGAPWLSFGVMGGAMQPQGHVQILVNLIDFGMDLQEAGDAPRVRHDGSSEPTGERMTDGGTVLLEEGFAAEVRAELARRGHALAPGDGGFGGYQAIARDPVSGGWIGASESRKDGCAAGY
jgi:gamma-glutamyltranspeptidase/glutathione hydrolase